MATLEPLRDLTNREPEGTVTACCTPRASLSTTLLGPSPQGTALRRVSSVPRPRASILELPPEERHERLKTLGEPERLGRLPERLKSLGPPQWKPRAKHSPQRSRAATVGPGRDGRRCQTPRPQGERKPKPRWRI
ncbi:unnamed protein product [Durusdinium trenchii]|uniref:Uncharacterized protein n=1 Tax=Durusdinium trenchii TaxID=1381693 RepID=A0ABP0SCR1_9DINO